MQPRGAPAVVWPELAPALEGLERLARRTERLETAHDLPRLQYALHVAHERAHGVDPEAELTLALALARDATAEVAEALEQTGTEGVEPLVWEWRGALFAVRLARARLATRDRTADAPVAGPLAATLLVVAGALVVLGGALAALWPVWAVGLALVGASVALSHRRP